MIKHLLLSILLLSTTLLSAQTTGTYVVADNGTKMISCVDTLITLNEILTQRGIHDLNDPSDNSSNYTLMELNGAVITGNVISGSFLYSAYPTVYVQKDGTHNGGIEIFLNLVGPAPTHLFDVDTLKYTVERGATVNYTQDFFSHANLWSSGLDNLSIQDRIDFKDIGNNGIDTIIYFTPNWATKGNGLYRLRMFTTGCEITTTISDTLFVAITESLCHNIEIKNMPSTCLEGSIVDVTPYVYVDGVVATTAQLADMTFWDKSDLLNQSDSSALNPTAINAGLMYSSSLYPTVEIVYQPNVDYGTCNNFKYILDTKVPLPLLSTTTVLTHDNTGYSSSYNLGGTYYSFNGLFPTNTFKNLYIDNYNVFAGSLFHIYANESFQSNMASNAYLTPGDYQLVSYNPACGGDSAIFNVHIQDRDFDIAWQSANNLGQGYYTFSAPEYDGATYAWVVWGGSIVNGSGTDQITVYYSETSSASVLVSCTITLPSARTTAAGTMGSSLYLTDNSGNQNYQEITPENLVTAVQDPSQNTSDVSVYPNPTSNTFSVSGSGTYALSIYNSVGQMVYQDLDYNANTPVSLNSKGVHILHLDQNDRRQQMKVIVQ